MLRRALAVAGRHPARHVKNRQATVKSSLRPAAPGAGHASIRRVIAPVFLIGVLDAMIGAQGWMAWRDMHKK